MSNQGLSIFDNEPEDSGDEPTQVIPRGENGKSGAEKSPAGPKSAIKVAEKPAERPAPASPTGRRVPDASDPRGAAQAGRTRRLRPRPRLRVSHRASRRTGSRPSRAAQPPAQPASDRLPSSRRSCPPSAGAATTPAPWTASCARPPRRRPASSPA